MRREIALRYVDKIAQRLHSVNGVLATPLCNQEAVRFKRVWVFGSTAKGAESPNDLDLLIEAEGCGRQRSWRQTRYDKDARRRFGYKATTMAIDEASEVADQRYEKCQLGIQRGGSKFLSTLRF